MIAPPRRAESGTNLQFAECEFSFVKTRAQHGTKEAFPIRDEHLHLLEPE